MSHVSILTINGEPKNERDPVKIAEDARIYFPKEIWDDIRYLGELSLEHDVKIATDGESFGAFLFEKLIKRIRKVKDSHRLMNLLLGITPDPIVAMYCFLDGRHLNRALYLVHDYVSETAGVVSFFRVNEKYSSKLVAHGLGHSRGLRHHLKPIDLMSSELLKIPTLQVEGFCKFCLRKLTNNQAET
jgi:predicted Zn-dependent protease